MKLTKIYDLKTNTQNPIEAHIKRSFLLIWKEKNETNL